MPRERSAKSAIVVPAVVVATITDQSRRGWKEFARTWATTVTTNSAIKITLPMA